MNSTGIYIHIPFCTRRCGYCDFNTFAGLSRLIPGYVTALCQEIEWVGEKHADGCIIDTVFFGGGTPSLLSIEQFSQIFDQLRCSFRLEPDAEVTLEANPGTVSGEGLRQLFGLGFTRVSFGMQSAHPDDLTILDREHGFTDVIRAVEWSRQAGFRHINLDLIFGIPGQSLERWQSSLRLAVAAGVDHLSLYNLTFEKGTRLERWYGRGLLDVVDDDLVADMYEYAIDHLGEYGFDQYEISNWALHKKDSGDSRCRHNLHTWQYHPYFGFGAGAHGFIGSTRTENVGPIPTYLQRMAAKSGPWPAAETATDLGRWEQMQEWMMVGLRLVNEGVSRSAFAERFALPMEKVFSKPIAKLLHVGLLEEGGEKNDRLRLTRRGVLLGNRVFSEFVGDEPPDCCKDSDQ